MVLISYYKGIFVFTTFIYCAGNLGQVL